MKNIRNEKIVFTPCPLCGKDDTGDDLWFGEYKYVRCRNCGLLYQNPRPESGPLRKRYSRKYFHYEFRNQRNFFNLMKLTLRDIRFAETVGRLFPEGKRKFLDIGCATGLLINHMRHEGWDVLGLELDRFSVRHARRTFRLPVIHSSLEDARLKRSSFDVIHWSHVIEHLPDPKKGLKKIHSLLRPGGFMLLTTPRLDSFQRRLFGKEWRSFHRDHVCLFTRAALLALVRQTGFTPVRFISWGGMAVDKEHPLRRFKPLLDWGAKFFNQGDVMFVLARK